MVKTFLRVYGIELLTDESYYTCLCDLLVAESTSKAPCLSFFDIILITLSVRFIFFQSSVEVNISLCVYIKSLNSLSFHVILKMLQRS